MTELRRGRLHDPSGAPAKGEVVEAVVEVDGFCIEQILSGELESPVDYLQDHDEWVVVLSGGAVLGGDHESVTLSAGDWVLLSSGRPHRLVSTTAGTSWLVVRGPRAKPPGAVDSRGR